MKQLTGKPLDDFLRQLERPDLDLVFLLQDVEDPVNVGAIFRITDGCGAREMILTGTTAVPPHPMIAGVGRGLHRRVPWRYVPQATDAIAALRRDGYASYAVELAAEAQPYDAVAYPGKVALVVGNEYRGVSRRTLAACDGALFVPMYGKGVSLNVHVALAIVAYFILHRGRRDDGSGNDALPTARQGQP